MVDVRGVVGAPLAGPSEVEEQLRKQLQGVRVVGEVPLELDGEYYLGSKRVCETLIRLQNLEKLKQDYPASLCIFLVAEGRYRYHEGNFWSSLSIWTPSNPNFHAKLGGAFLDSLARLQLETFGQVQVVEQGHRYVVPILLHGGIPSYCVVDLWKLIASEVRSGIDDGAQLFANWRDRPYLIATLDKPAQRFLKFGGEFAEDLVGRMINFILASQESGESSLDELDILASKAGVPSYLLQGDLKSLIRGIASPKGSTRHRFPLPSVVLDLYSGEGPSLRLPSVISNSVACMNWLVQGSSTHRPFPASRDEREVRLDPDSPWQVILESDDEGISKTSSFVGHQEASVYFFDGGSGRLLRHQDALRAEQVVALAPKGFRFYASESDEAVVETEELPLLSGPWAAWDLHRLNLAGLGELRLVWSDASGNSRDVRIRVVSAASRPSLETAPLDGVLTSTGLPVFNTVPKLVVPSGATSLGRWRVQFRNPDFVREFSLEDLPHYESVFDLEGFLPSGDLLLGELVVLGPLGSDFRVELCVIPGLRVSVPGKTFGPREVIEVNVHAPGIYLDGNRDQVTVRDTSNQGTCSIEATGSVGQVTLRVSLPRLLWKVRAHTGVGGTDSGELITLGLDEFEAGGLDAMLIRVGRPAFVQLQLVDEDSVLYESVPLRTGGPEGRIAVPLSPMYETIRNAERVRMCLRVVCPDIQVDVAEIVGCYVVSDVSVESELSVEGEKRWFLVSFNENRAFHNRILRVWSYSRIWEAQLEIKIEDRDHNCCLVGLDRKLQPGPYLFEVAVADAWSDVSRPSIRDPSVAKFDVGTSEELDMYLDTRDKRRSLEALETVNCGGCITTSELAAVADEEFGYVVRSLLQQIVEWQTDALLRTGCRCLAEAVFEHPERFAEWLAYQGPRHLTRKEFQELGIVLMPDILDCPPDNLDVRVRDRLWSLSVVFGAGFTPYRVGNVAAAAYWHYFTGWNPAMPPSDKDSAEERDQLPSRGGGMQATYVNLGPDRLSELTSMFCPDEVKPLRWTGYLSAAFEFLANTWDEREIVDKWQLKFASLYDEQADRDPVHENFLEKLESEPGMPDWCRFPQLLLACAFHLVSFGGNRNLATSALWEARQFAPALTERSLLVGIALHRLGM